jgi:hypothetical protein
VLAHGHQTELETLFDFGCYNYAAPDGVENESKWDTNPSARLSRLPPAEKWTVFDFFTISANFLLQTEIVM